MKKTVKIISFILLIALALTFSLIAYFFVVTKDVTLDENKLKANASYPKIYYENGVEIKNESVFSYVTIDDIPSHVKNALIAIEDKRFYSHKGVDGKSVLRALKENLFSKSVKQGASTITQQLVKNTYLSGEKTLNRKLKEIKLALLLEQKLSKDEILEKYFNTVYFGENSYGIYSASKRFFDKEPKDLTLIEGATLIACLKAPSTYNPYKNKEKSNERKNLIISEMYRQGYLDLTQYENCKNQEIILNYKTNYDCENNLYNEILNQANSILQFENPYEIGDDKIFTKLDEQLCLEIKKACNYDIKTDFSVIVTENKTSSVVGYYSTIVNQKRIPASTVKPFLIYAPAFEENLICPATKILDEKTSFDGYSPSNYKEKYYGYVSAKDALMKSLNVPSAKIYNSLGGEKVKYYAKKMDIDYTNNDTSVALGNLTGGITLKQLNDAYSVFLNDGYFIKSSFISCINNKNQQSIYNYKANKVGVFSSSTAFLINDVLKDCAKTGTASKLSALNFPVCAKTGTNGNENGNLDAYCIAYTPDYIISVWLGNADQSYFSNQISGGNYPTAIAKDVLSYLYPNGDAKFFSAPSTVKEIEIDKNAYENDCIIYKNAGKDCDGVKFYFKSDFPIKELPKKEIIPFIKDYKITCLSRDISIFIEIDDAYNYKIFDSDNNELFDSKNGGNLTVKTEQDGEYTFYAQPYYIDNEKYVFGEKIKLPSVLVEGKKQILDTEWWED